MSKTNDKPKKGGVTPRGAIYAVVSGKRELILNKLLELLESKNESISLGAAKVLFNKLLPDLKATDVTSDGEKITVVFHKSLEQKNE